jgi:hypothetical protein
MQYRHSYYPDATVEMLALQPLKDLSPAEFKALGSTGTVYIRAKTGAQIAELVTNSDFAPDDVFQVVLLADGSPLLVTDNPGSLAEWLSEKNFIVATLH